MTKTRLMIACLVAAISLAAVPVVGTIVTRLDSAENSNLALLAGVIQLVQRVYVHPVNSDELTNDALKGMLNRLDPHSDYMDEQEFKDSKADIAGKFGGLGMQIGEENDLPKVISPIDGTPAAHAGLEPGDDIVMINRASTRGMSLQKVVDLLRGDPGSTVTITILRGKQAPFDVTLTREIIHVKSVKSQLEPDGKGYIRISQFGEDTADGVKQAIDKLKQDANGNLK